MLLWSQIGGHMTIIVVVLFFLACALLLPQPLPE
jgi:hypothetical protein